MAFSLPMAHAANKLSACRPTASLFGPRTLCSVCGMLAINFFFIVMGMVALNQQDWFQCRKWGSTDISSVTTIGDNYEATVLFTLGGFQYLSSAIALNFGYKFRAAWHTNYVFVFFATTWFVMHLVMALYPSSFSCIWRVNCDNEVRYRCVLFWFITMARTESTL
jgi:magnesium-transporting ATPase (P-type)